MGNTRGAIIHANPLQLTTKMVNIQRLLLSNLDIDALILNAIFIQDSNLLRSFL